MAKRAVIIVGLILSAGAWAQSSDAPTTPDAVVLAPAAAPLDAVVAPVVAVSSELPAVVAVPTRDAPRVSAHPKLREKFTGRENLLLKFRYSENMPEITSEALLGGAVDQLTLDRLNSGADKIGTMPRLTVLPCNSGCVGNDDYTKAVKAFLNNYDQAVKSGHVVYRGTMKIKVRWFNQRGFLARQNPLPHELDVFAISFPLEGMLITLSRMDKGTFYDMKDLAVNVSGQLSAMLFLQVGVGIKPGPLRTLLEDEDALLTGLRSGLLAIDKVFNIEDRRARIEPMTEAFNELLPAIDGIEPNEVDPITEKRYI